MHSNLEICQHVYRKCLLSLNSLKHEKKRHEPNGRVFNWIINQAHNYMVFVALDLLCPGEQLTKQSFKVIKWNKLERSLLGGC